MISFEIKEILEDLTNIESDNAVPRNVRTMIKTTIEILKNCDGCSEGITIDRSLEQLGDIAEDPNLPQHTRMQIWNLVSQLERK